MTDPYAGKVRKVPDDASGMGAGDPRGPRCVKRRGMFSSLFRWLLKTVAGTIVAMVVVTGVLMCMLLLLAMALTAVSEGHRTAVQPNSYLVLRFQDEIPEGPSRAWIYETLSFHSVLRALDRAVDDAKIKGVILALDEWGIDSEKTEELVPALTRMREAGKTVHAYGSRIDNHNYMIAAAADEIVMPPTDSASVSLTGYNTSVLYYKGLADKIGVDVRVFHVGDYKGFGENYTRQRMSDTLRGEVVRVLDQEYEVFTSCVAEGRGVDRDAFSAMILEGRAFNLTPTQAVQHGFVDRTAYYHDLLAGLAAPGGGAAPTIDVADYAALAGEKKKVRDAKIAVFFAEGTILDQPADGGLGSIGTITPAGVREVVENILADDSIKAVVLRVNSPGGSALASELILQQLSRLKDSRPLIVSMGSVAASGGYYISCKGDHIFSGQRTITGSIGVVSLVPKITALAEKIGVNVETVSKGKFADLYDMTRELTEADTAVITQSMERVYREFKSRVAEGRGLPPEDLESAAQGHIWTGRQACDVGLVDEIGGLESAIREAAGRSKLTEYSLVTYPKPISLFERLAEGKFVSAQGSETTGVPEIDACVKQVRRIRALAGRPLYLLPIEFLE